MWSKQLLWELVHNFKSPALLKVKIEKFKAPPSPILTSLIWRWFLTTWWVTHVSLTPPPYNFASDPVSQSCAVTKSEIFWWDTGPSNLADRMEDCSTGHSAVVRIWKPTFGSFLLQLAVCMPSLIVQWPTRSFHFSLLCKIVKLADGWTF